MSEIGWQEWCRNNITNSGLNPKSAAARAWVYQKAKIEERDKRIALLEAENQQLIGASQKLLDACIASRDAYYDSEYWDATAKRDEAMDELQALLQEDKPHE